jgi:hypothetical protein
MLLRVPRRGILAFTAALVWIGFTTGLIASSFSAQQTPKVAESTPKFSHDPDSAQIVTRDIDNFWRAYDHIGPNNGVEVFQKEYIDKGSIGLRDFVQLRIGSAGNLARNVSQYPRYYRSIRASTYRISSSIPLIRASFRRLKDLYPDAVFPDVYFVIGRMSSGGTTSDNGLLIGTEMYGRTPEMPIAELDEWYQQVLKPIDALPGIVAHELIHVQQEKLGARMLLAAAIREGSADFVGELISGLSINSQLQKYGNDHERELWLEFKTTMLGADSTKWLGQGVNAKDRPADLGYYMGYKITQSYYQHSSDKKQAVREILQIQDAEQFLKKSRYEERFANTQTSAR